MRRKIVLIALSSLFIFSCGNIDSPNSLIDETFILTKKWYTNEEDDRYYCEFKPDGVLYYRYYQYFGSSSSGLNTFITKMGTWKYLDEDKLHFSVGWDDSIDCYYYIKEASSDKIVLEKDTNGPAGRGFGDITELFTNAANISFIVPDEIVNLMGTWFYNDTKDGKYLMFQSDGKCVYHYYQDFGSSSGLTGWVNKSGVWSYNTETQRISITMSGEVAYNYEIEVLNITTLKLSGLSISMIYNEDQFYK